MAITMNTTMGRALTWATFLGAACGVLYLSLLIVRPFVNVIAWAVVLAIVCQPVHERLVHRTKRIALSAFLTSVLTVIAFVVPVLLLGGVAVTEGVALGRSLHGTIPSPEQPFTRFAAVLASLTSRVGIDQGTIADWLQQHATEWAHSAGQHTLTIAAGLADAGSRCEPSPEKPARRAGWPSCSEWRPSARW